MQRSTRVLYKLITRVGKVLILFALLCIVALKHVSAQILLKGTVVEKISKAPVQGVTVGVSNPKLTTATDETGRFVINLPLSWSGESVWLTFNSLGFESVELAWDLDKGDVFVEMEKADQALDQVVVSGRGRYRNRDNPAVELIRNVTSNRSNNRLSAINYIEYRSYEKVVMAVSNVSKLVSQNPLFRNFDFVFDNVDTTLSPGRKLLPIYIEENLAREYSRSRPETKRIVVEATSKTELDKRFINNENIQASISYLHSKFDIYDNTLLLFNRPFMSPVASGAPLFYKYAIRDTVYNAGEQYIILDFVPRNEEERLFSGNIWISNDGRYAIKSAEIKLDARANINWINDVHIKFDFKKDILGMHLPVSVESRVNFGLYGSKEGMFSQWLTTYGGYKTGVPSPGVFQGAEKRVEPGADQNDSVFWELMRPVPLSKAESQTFTNIDSLHNNRSFMRLLEWVTFAVTSYKRIGPIEVGPLEYAYSFNDLEGSRFRVGGRSSRDFSDQFYGEAYLAYGLNDRRWKYYGGAALSLNGKKVNAYPAHYVHLTYQHDNREPGQLLGFLNGDSFFRSFRTANQDKWMFHTKMEANHIIEFGNHIRLQTSLSKHKQQSAGSLIFKRVGDGQLLPEINTTEFGIDLRWAPNEEYFQRDLIRTPILNRYPVLNLRYNTGIKGLLGGEYTFHALRFDMTKRMYMSLLGFSDIAWGGGYIFGTVPFPLLDIPMADQSILLSPDSYSLMNNLEFVSDHYAKFSLEHHFEGFFLNKIPLLKKLKIRELAGFKVFYGQLRQENDPRYNPGIFAFPTNSDGVQSTFSFSNRPYVEASVGLENILNVIRIEYVKRLSYLNHPDLKKGGLRFSVRIGF